MVPMWHRRTPRVTSPERVKPQRRRLLRPRRLRRRPPPARSNSGRKPRLRTPLRCSQTSPLVTRRRFWDRPSPTARRSRPSSSTRRGSMLWHWLRGATFVVCSSTPIPPQGWSRMVASLTRGETFSTSSRAAWRQQPASRRFRALPQMPSILASTTASTESTPTLVFVVISEQSRSPTPTGPSRTFSSDAEIRSTRLLPLVCRMCRPTTRLPSRNNQESRSLRRSRPASRHRRVLRRTARGPPPATPTAPATPMMATVVTTTRLRVMRRSIRFTPVQIRSSSRRRHSPPRLRQQDRLPSRHRTRLPSRVRNRRLHRARLRIRRTPASSSRASRTAPQPERVRRLNPAHPLRRYLYSFIQAVSPFVA